ncbi:MAG: metallophosphoesterase [Bryobacterales bacterium]|nr:metallophosphoesterase [Bryobacterales bacterium]
MFLLLLVSSLSAQQDGSFFFVQISDPQFGFQAGDKDFEQETAAFEFVVSSLNRLRPAFVVATGDLVNRAGDPAQTAEYLRIASRLDRSIPLYNVAGNHDLGNQPAPASLAAYRERFGRDYYSFRHGSLFGIVLNTSLITAPEKAPAEAAQQEAWLRGELGRARASGAAHIVVFQHYPWFLEKPDEPDQYFNVPLERRRPYLDLLKAAGVRYVFAGHLHRNGAGRDGELQMITTGPVGRPLGADPSGIRVVLVRSDRLEHSYYGLGSLPNRIEIHPSRIP